MLSLQNGAAAAAAAPAPYSPSSDISSSLASSSTVAAKASAVLAADQHGEAFSVGTRIEALSSDKWYPAVIKQVSSDTQVCTRSILQSAMLGTLFTRDLLLSCCIAELYNSIHGLWY
jgi:hypothetical protein